VRECVEYNMERAKANTFFVFFILFYFEVSFACLHFASLAESGLFLRKEGRDSFAKVKVNPMWLV